jgi:hypothetical protein
MNSPPKKESGTTGRKQRLVDSSAARFPYQAPCLGICAEIKQRVSIPWLWRYHTICQAIQFPGGVVVVYFITTKIQTSSFRATAIGLSITASRITKVTQKRAFVRYVCEDPSISDSLQIGQNVTTEERSNQGSSGEIELTRSAEK